MTRGRDGRPRPHRSGEPEQFHRCGDIAALQALARATRAAGQRVLVLGAAAHRGGRRRQGRGWRDAAVGRRRHPGHAVASPRPARSAWPCAWSSSPAEHPIRASRGGTSTWPPRAGWPPTSSRPRTPAWPSCWVATASATAAGSCACPARATSRADGRGAGVVWWRATCTHRRVDVEAVLGALPPRAAADAEARRDPGQRLGSRLESLAPREWFALLEPDRPISEYGYARCPLHDDHIPSLKLYDEPRDGWYCWACARGGDLIEYAAWRWYGQSSRGLDAPRFARSSPVCRPR